MPRFHALHALRSPGILLSLLVCAILYATLALVLCGMVPFSHIGLEAPLTTAFTAYHQLHWVQQVVDIGACVGLTTTLLVGLYSQSRIYLAMARDELLPRAMAEIHPRSGVPLYSQLVCGVLAATLAACLDVSALSDILSIGIMSACECASAAVFSLLSVSTTAQVKSTK